MSDAVRECVTAVAGALHGRPFVGGQEPSAEDAALFERLCGGSDAVARWIRAVCAATPEERASWRDPRPPVRLLSVRAGETPPPLEPGTADLKVGVRGDKEEVTTLRVPEAALELSTRAAVFLRKRRFVAWCRHDRSLQNCGSRFSSGVSDCCPFAHVSDPRVRGLCRDVLISGGYERMLQPDDDPEAGGAATLAVPEEPLPPASAPAERAAWVAQRLTVVITTSPCRSNPSTTLLEAVLSTFSRIPQLDACRVVIVCDGCDVVAEDGTGRRRAGFKRGLVSPGAAQRYEEYKRRVRALADERVGTTVVLELADRHGFGWAVREALRLHAHTPFVMVVQHDRYFTSHSFDLPALLDGMCKDPSLGVVYMLNLSLVGHLSKVRGRLAGRPLGDGASWEGEWLQPRVLAEGVAVSPCLAWLDSTHIARRDHLQRFVFGAKGVPAGSGVPIHRGEFPEDRINQVQVRALLTEGSRCHARFATWVLGGDAPHVLHLSGRAFRVEGTGGQRAVEILRSLAEEEKRGEQDDSSEES